MKTSIDPVVLLARQRVIQASAELEVALQEKKSGNAAVQLLWIFKARAAESLAALATADLFTEKGRAEALALQNEVKRYDEWFAAIREIVHTGIAFDNEMKDAEREAMVDILTSKGPQGEREAVELGLIDIPGTID